MMMDDVAAKAIEVLKSRRAIYMHKYEKADPNGEDMFTRWDLNRVLVEAFDIALMELCGKFGLPAPAPLITDY